MSNNNDDLTNLLVEFFGIVCAPAKPKRTRKHATIKAVEDNGYAIAREGNEWVVWHPENQSVEAVYERLSDIDIESPV